MNTDTKLTADEILDELCALEGGDIGMLPTIENHCDGCSGVDGSCAKYTTTNECSNCGSVGTLYISWNKGLGGNPWFSRDCRFCGDCC